MLVAGLCIDSNAPAADEQKLQRYGRHLAEECAACHRNATADNGPPSLAGTPAETFITTLDFYRTGARTNPVMVSVARSLDDEQVKALAAYYASLPKPAPKGTAAPVAR